MKDDIIQVAGSPGSNPRDGESRNFDLRIMGADLMAEDRELSEVVCKNCFTLDPKRYTPKDGFHLGKTVPFFSVET